ncbi:uncharacterized protein LOC118198818 [Stegodyphus dumicola]|uniref:uncharacterized protein LOC118198818 n=1 Tax=Stegodyphus dumicola TaxID=202533 RepID=UPI0015B27B7B|nr:uncharacterized protein LOC118198818 [Stegodyphus dumicola]
MILHKWHTKSQELRELWITEGNESEESSHVSEARNPPLKVLGAACDNQTSPENCHYCYGKCNPADMAARGAKFHELKNNPTWFQGPEWLSMSTELWPGQNEGNPVIEEELEYRKNINEIVCTAVEERVIDISKYSHLRKLLRITGWMKRFIGKIRKTNHLTGPSRIEEIVDAENQNEILRAGGRLEHSSLSHDEKHPAILSKDSWLTNLIVESARVKMMYEGVATTLAEIQSRTTSQLPEDRINETPPFYMSGIDFARPIYIKNIKGSQKAYVTCAITSAIHLELVPNLSTNSFLIAFKRFTSRRGNCQETS